MSIANTTSFQSRAGSVGCHESCTEPAGPCRCAGADTTCRDSRGFDPLDQPWQPVDEELLVVVDQSSERLAFGEGKYDHFQIVTLAFDRLREPYGLRNISQHKHQAAPVNQEFIAYLDRLAAKVEFGRQQFQLELPDEIAGVVKHTHQGLSQSQITWVEKIDNRFSCRAPFQYGLAGFA